MRRRWLALLALLPVLLGAADYPPPQTMHQTGAEKWFGGLVLQDQDGKRVDLHTDLMADKVVVINAFFTSCRSACPQVMGTIAHLQAEATLNGISANFISITVDPEHDTPEVLGPYARSLGAEAGWSMLNGDPAMVRRALGRFGLNVASTDPNDHLNILYMANLRTGLWKKVFSLAPIEDLERILQEVENDRGP
jgi:protein SCO1/2